MKFEQIKNNKDTNVKFRVTKEQKEFIKYICSIKKVNVSEYILDLIKEDIKKNKYVD